MTMEKILTQLEAIFNRLEVPQELESSELESLDRDWHQVTAQLDALSEESMRRQVVRDPFLKPRLQILVERLPQISAVLGLHKMEVAEQLRAQNRKLQSMRQGYGRTESKVVLYRHQA
ncbi:MAG TPA: hypothetical protein HPQ00_07550 [Magnetococcales bacterium]|nr:hypothetical protein [Magnetococcales bacterium]